MEAIMKQIDNKMFESFKQNIQTVNQHFKETIPRKGFVMSYLQSFLGNYFSREMLDCDDDQFGNRCESIVNSVSLCGPEIDYFIKMARFVPESNDYSTYINDLIAMYDNTENLAKCQLGNNMKRFLEHSNGLKFCK